jgi:hypothetical protein
MSPESGRIENVQWVGGVCRSPGRGRSVEVQRTGTGIGKIVQEARESEECTKVQGVGGLYKGPESGRSL